MSRTVLLKPQLIPVGRSEFRQNQSKLLRKARGRKVLLVRGPGENAPGKYVLDKQYFDEVLKKCASLIETLEIMADRKLFSQILGAAGNLERDLRRGRLHSFEEAFQEK
jgi:hypothetical protein